MLSLAFAPDYATSERFYVSYATETNSNIVAEYTGMPGGANTALPWSRREILRIEHGDNEFRVHFGGAIAFSPADGMLYFTTGDSDDALFDKTVFASQDPGELREKVLRIDPLSDLTPPAISPPRLGTSSLAKQLIRPSGRWAFETLLKLPLTRSPART